MIRAEGSGTASERFPAPESLPELRWSSGSLGSLGSVVMIHSPDDATVRAASLAQAEGEEPEPAAIGRALERMMERLEALAPETADREMNPMPTDRGSVAEALTAFVGGDHAALESIAVHQPGSDYRRAVWAAMREVPAGETVSYAELAQMAGRPLAHRAAASACANNLVAFAVPCHRVIRADGTLGGYGFGGVETKRRLLAREGIYL